MAKTLDEAKKKLDDEYGQVRRKFDRIHTAFDRVISAGPEDDVYDRLKELAFDYAFVLTQLGISVATQ